MYRILISGYYGFNNIGDESILRTMVDNLRSRIDDVEITILSRDPEDTAAKYGVRAVPRMSVPAIIKAVKECDLLISGGGSLLQDVTSNSSILYYLFIIRVAQLFRKKVILYSQGIGPIGRSFNRRITARYLKRVDEIAVRDQASARLLAAIGVPEDLVSVTADPVIGIHPADLEEGRKILEAAGCSMGTTIPTEHDDGTAEATAGAADTVAVATDFRGPLVGWAIKSGDLNPAFMGEIEACIEWLAEKYGARSVLIPFHYDQDLQVVEYLGQRLGDKAVCLTSKYLSQEMLSIIGNLDCLTGVRLHSLIFAAVMEVPSIGISYDPKIDAFMESIGRKCVADVDSFSLEAFKREFEDVMSHRDEIKADTALRTAELKGRLDENDEIIKRVLKGEVSATKPAAESEASATKSPARKGKRGGILAAIGSVMVITILAKVLGIVREAIQANVFGAEDALYASYNKTIYLYTTMGYAVCVAAVPLITKALERSRREGERVANNLTTFSLLISIGAMFMWMGATVPTVANALWQDQSGELIPFMRIMALTLPVIVLTYLMVAVYQSMDHFALQGSISLPYSVFLIGYLLVAAEKLSIVMYVVAIALAWVLQFLMTVPCAIQERYLYRPVLDLRAPYIGTFLKTAVVTIVTTSAYLFCYLIDAAHAADLGEGWTSAFYYADKVFTPLVTTFIYSISAVLFPKLNRQFTRTDHKEYLEYVWGITSSTLVVVFPVSAILMVMGGPVVRVLFESGNFTAESTVITAGIFAMYAVGMAGFSIIDLLNKAFFSMGKSLAPLLISIGVIVLNFILDAVFDMSGQALALSTAVAMTMGAVATMIVMFRGSGVVKLGSVVKSIGASVITGGLAYYLKALIMNDAAGKLLTVAEGILVGCIAMAVFGLICIILKVPEITRFVKRS